MKKNKKTIKMKKVYILKVKILIRPNRRKILKIRLKKKKIRPNKN